MAHVSVVAVNIVGTIDAIRMLVWRVLYVLSISVSRNKKHQAINKYYPHIDNSSTRQLRKLEEVTVAFVT